MRSVHTRSFVALLALATAFATACAAPAADETGAIEADITDRLPPANAAPLLDAEEIAFLNALNKHRMSTPDPDGIEDTDMIPPLRVSIGLVKAARKHSKEMADLNAVDATHNDGGKGDQGALRDEAIRATRARIKAEYPINPAEGAENFGEDCARREDIGSAAAAFKLLRENLADTGQPGFGDQPAAFGPNMLNVMFESVGVARAKGSNGKWYWTVTYGEADEKRAPMMSLDDSTGQSVLTNGSFEAGSEPEGPELSPGNWDTPASWEGAWRLNAWHQYADHGGSVTIRADNAFFLDGTAGAPAPGKAHGLRIVDPAASGATANATQIVLATPGVNYEVTARARKVGNDDSQPAAYLDFIDAKYKRIGVTTVKAGALTSWNAEPIRVSATAPARTAYVRVILYSTSKAGHGSTYDWDDVRLRAW